MIDIKEQSPIALAFVGDAVYSLAIRRRLVSQKKLPVGKLNLIAAKYVSARGQNAALDILREELTDEEKDWIRRGRNANKTAVAKNASPAEYRASTGFECMLGFLRLEGRNDRIDRLVDCVLEKIPF